MKNSIVILGIIFLSLGCTKSDFLSKKPDDSLVVPESLSDFQAILDNEMIVNGHSLSRGLTSYFGDASCDDFSVLENDYNTFTDLGKNIYIWKKDLYTGSGVEDEDWKRLYRVIFYANVVLDGLAKITSSTAETDTYNQIKGNALFCRAYMLWHLAQCFCPPYIASSAQTDLGLPLRLASDINESIVRSSVKSTYDQIIGDLNAAKRLLPEKTIYKTRGSKNTTYALLTRVYVSMRDYENAYLNADSSLKINAALLDYNTVALTSTTSVLIPKLSNEVLYESVCNASSGAAGNTFSGYSRVDKNLYDSYSNDDLRKTIFFRNRTTVPTDVWYSFRGNYAAGVGDFSGIANDEILLIRAECSVRRNNVASGMNDLNTLLSMRFTRNTNGTTKYIPRAYTTQQEALAIVIEERRKELLFRSLRWSDLRRLNQEPSFAKTINRTIAGTTYALPPNDLRYTFPIPLSVIGFNPSMPQNPR